MSSTLTIKSRIPRESILSSPKTETIFITQQKYAVNTSATPSLTICATEVRKWTTLEE